MIDRGLLMLVHLKRTTRKKNYFYLFFVDCVWKEVSLLTATITEASLCDVSLTVIELKEGDCVKRLVYTDHFPGEIEPVLFV